MGSWDSLGSSSSSCSGCKVIGFLIGGLIGLVLKLAWFAFLGWMIYTIIRVLSPSTADRIREMVRGKPSEA